MITAAGTTRTPDDTALSQAIAAARPGQQVTLAITRSAQQLTVQVTLGELPGSWPPRQRQAISIRLPCRSH